MKTIARSAPKSRGMKRIDLAYVDLASGESARDINRDVVLELVRSKQPVARADIARASGLQPSTVSAIVKQLIEEKWVKEGAVDRRPRGRRPTLVSLNDELVILTVDVRPKQAIVALLDLNMRFIEREVVPLVSDADAALCKIVLRLEAMRAAHPNRTFEGIGMSMPGRVDLESQRLVLAPNLKWDCIDIKGIVQAKMGLQVELMNAANACLLAELWSGRLDGVRNAVLITVSEGVGAAILANGNIVTGRSGLAGEFGHSMIDPTGPLCGCGQRGCWEVFASSSAALRYYAESCPESAPISIHELLRMAEEEDPQAIAAISRQVTWLGRGLRLVTTALSPEVVLFAGDITTSWDRFGPLIQAEMQRTMLAGNAPRLDITNDGELARLRGAAAVVLQRHSGYQRSALEAGVAKGEHATVKIPAPASGTATARKRASR